ncbi:16148_t:CDS:1, partial [Funneliformis geosporum]
QTTQIIFDGKILPKGDLVIENFPKLVAIAIPDHDEPERMSSLPKVQIRNCPQLKQVKIILFEVQNFSISDCPKVEKLDLRYNELTSLNISELVNLVDLDCSSNSLTTLDISHNLKLKVLECDDDLKPKIS